MIDRMELRYRLSDILTREYVALLGQRGSGINVLVNQLNYQDPLIEGMIFVCVELPFGISKFEDFIDLVHQRLINTINNIDKNFLNTKNQKKRTAEYRFQDTLDKLNSEFKTTYLVIIFHINNEIPEELLRKLLSIARGYHFTRMNQKIRFLVAGGSCLWHLCIHPSAEKSPFNKAQIIFLEGLSSEEIIANDPEITHDLATDLINLTGGIPSLVETMMKDNFDTGRFSHLFNRLQKNWSYLPDNSKNWLKDMARANSQIPITYIPHCDCEFIAEDLKSPLSEAFWNGFLKLKNQEIVWQSPIHEAFVKEKIPKNRQISSSAIPNNALYDNIASINSLLRGISSNSYKICWIHISDLHFTHEYQKDADYILDKLLIDIKDQIKKLKLVPNFVFLTGDVSYSSDRREYNSAEVFLNKLKDAIAIDKDLIYIVPGNHDIDRQIINKIDPNFFNSTHSIKIYEELDNLLENKKVLIKY